MPDHEDDDTPPFHGEALEPVALSSAEAGIRRCLRAVGQISQGERYGAEWRALESWCEEQGLILPTSLVPERQGGREHDLKQLPALGTWLKFTKPWASGYAVHLGGAEPLLLPATPTQYLARLLLQNRYFGDAMRFVGITGDRRARRMVISQPDIIGRPATWDEIAAWFKKLGFTKLRVKNLGEYEAWAFAGHGVGVFDVRPVNVVVTDEGELLPIDLIMRRLTQFQTKRLVD